MEPKSDLFKRRFEKLKSLREKGLDPFPAQFSRTHLSAKVIDDVHGLIASQEQVRVAGRMISMRRHGRSHFAHILDGTGRIQIYLRQEEVGEESFALFGTLDIGDIIGAWGPVFQTKTGEVTVRLQGYSLLTKSLRCLPEKWHGLRDKETRYRQRYVDLIANPEVRHIFRLRSWIIAAIREFLTRRGFIEVETPILQPLYGGGAAEPFVTHHNKLGMDLYLRIADELYLKRLIIGGFEKVWEFCKDFRNEGMDRLHNPEFSMVELYQAYVDYNDIMVLFEELMRFTVEQVHGATTIEFEGQTLDFGQPFRRLPMLESIIEYGGPDLSDFDFERARKLAHDAGLAADGLISHGQVVEAFFAALVEPKLFEPTFITDFPRDISPLAKPHRDNPRLVERFEAFIGGIECANAFSELTDPMDQRDRFMEQRQAAAAGDSEAHQIDEDFLTALSYGMPPTGGLGFGIDRLVMLLTDSHNIRDVIFFPQMKPETGEE